MTVVGAHKTLASLIAAVTIFGVAAAGPPLAAQPVQPAEVTDPSSFGWNVDFVSLTGGKSDAIAMADDLVYLGIGRTIEVIDVSNREQPRRVGGIPFLAGHATDLVVDGGRLFATVGNGGLQIFDVSVPSQPSLLATVRATSYTWTVDVVGTIAYVGNDAGILQVLDLSDPKRPVELASLRLSASPALGIDVSGDHAFVAVGGKGLFVVGVSEPRQPKELKVLETNTAWTDDVVVMGDYAYVHRAPTVRLLDRRLPLLSPWSTLIRCRQGEGTAWNQRPTRHLASNVC